MRFIEAVRSGFSHYVATSGRASRPAFWWWLLFANVAIAVPSIANLALAGAAPLDDRMLWTTRLLMLGLMLPTGTLLVRRLHDTNRSGRWLLLALIPVVGTVALMVIAAMPGTHGPNAYGAKADEASAAFPVDLIANRGLADRVRGLAKA